MKIKKFMVQLMLIALLVVSAQVTANDVEVHGIMGWLDSAEATTDARKALKNGDTRLWAVREIVLYLPGIEGEDKKLMAEKYGYRVVEGTSDGLVTGEHARLNTKAKEYAEKYNACVISNHTKQ